MPKTPSNKLYRLVHALSGPEKRYFKVLAGAQNDKDNKYLQLFDAIEQQSAFDDEALKEQIYGSRDIQSRKYSELKGYLYEMILKSLQAYDEKSSVAYRLKHLLLSVRVLFRRSLFEDCKEVLKKARKLAQRYERFRELLEILEWEKQIAYTQAKVDYLDRELHRIEQEERRVLERIKTIADYRNTFFRLLVATRKKTARSGELKQTLSDIVDTPLLKEFALADSHQAKVLYYRALSVYYFANAELQEFYQSSQQLISLMESQPHYLKEDVSEYIAALSNAIMSCGVLGKDEELEPLLAQLRSVEPITSDDELKIHRQYYQGMFSLCITTGRFEEGYRALQEHLQELKRFNQAPFQTQSFFLFYFYLSFGAGQYEEALDYLNDWLELPQTVERPHLQGAARMLNLIVHFELNHYELLESLLRSTYRFLKKRGQLYEVERLTLNFIRQALEAPSTKALREAYNSLKAEFEDLSQQPQTKAFFTKVFDILAWLESKTEGMTFAEVVQRKYKESTSAA